MRLCSNLETVNMGGAKMDATLPPEPRPGTGVGGSARPSTAPSTVPRQCTPEDARAGTGVDESARPVTDPITVDSPDSASDLPSPIQACEAASVTLIGFSRRHPYELSRRGEDSGNYFPLEDGRIAILLGSVWPLTRKGIYHVGEQQTAYPCAVMEEENPAGGVMVSGYSSVANKRKTISRKNDRHVKNRRRGAKWIPRCQHVG